MAEPASSITDLFRRLSPRSTAAPDTFVAMSLPGMPLHRIARAADGSATLLLHAKQTGEGAWPPPIVLEHLTVRHNLLCRIMGPEGHTEEGRFTVVSCVNADDNLTLYFLRVASVLVEAVGADPSQADVRNAVSQLVELLRAMAQPPTRSIQGLWAELLLMARAADPLVLATGWHQLPGDLFDFAADKQRLEVKAAAGPLRRHYFALAQLQPAGGLDPVVASMMVNRAASGISVADLVERVRTRLQAAPALALAVEQVSAVTLGSDWQLAHVDRFDESAATASIRLYSAARIPKVPGPLPAQVTDVRFAVDLTGVDGDPKSTLHGPLVDAI